jgi:hypothetical protein
MPALSHRLPRLLTIGLIVAALLAYETWTLFVKRSGEAAWLPPAADVTLSPEIAGDVTLDQGFVMNADGLEAIRVFPHRSTAEPQGVAEFVLLGSDYGGTPIARVSVPAATVAATPVFEWPVPRVNESTERRFLIRISVPAAAPGHGLRFELGDPGYRWGELAIGGRSYWGDLRFGSRAARARLIDVLTDLRRQAPSPLRSDLLLVAALVLFNWALATLVVRVATRVS